MTTRWEVEKAVCWSNLEPSARLIVLALLTKADNDTAVVKPEHAPSLTTLAAMTGLSRSTVADWLNGLEDAGWIKRHRPAKGGRSRTSYTLLAGSPTAKKRPRTASASGGDAPASGSPTGGLVRQADQSTSPTIGPLLVRPSDSTSPTIGPATTKTSYQKPSLTPAAVADGPATTDRERAKASPKDFPRQLLAERYDDLTGDELERVLSAIVAKHKPKGPAWWRHVANNGDLDEIVADERAQVDEDRSAEIAAAIRKAEREGPHCYDHTTNPAAPIPGGAFIHPTSGQPLCPYCRRGIDPFRKDTE